MEACGFKYGKDICPIQLQDVNLFAMPQYRNCDQVRV